MLFTKISKASIINGLFYHTKNTLEILKQIILSQPLTLDPLKNKHNL
jgi:hypothetical protein